MFDSLIALPTFAPTIFNPWHLTLEEKFPEADFPVRICITSELSSLLNPTWNLIVSFLGAGSSLCNPSPQRSFVQSSLHFFIAYLVNSFFFTETNSFIEAAFVVVDVSSSLVPLCLNFFNLHPVASFASLSAASFPRTPIWAGTQWISTVDLHSLRRSMACTIRCIIY